MLTEAGLVAIIVLVVLLAIAITAICAFMCRRHRNKSVRLESAVFKRLVPRNNPHEENARGGNQNDFEGAAAWRPLEREHSTHSTHSQEHGFSKPGSRTSSLRSVTSVNSQRSLANLAEEIGSRSVETHATLIIPNGLRLLKTCKALVHKLTATVIDFTSSASNKGLVVGSREEIVSCANMVSEAVDALTKSMYPPIDDTDILTNATELVNAAEELVLVSKFNCKQDKLDWLDKSTRDVLHDFKVLVDSVQKYRNLHKTAVVEFVSDA
eukprot:m.30894 g.30894  ORF g.30894 m.30894 type:complete len:268 (-) comp6856_c0_seq1:131-934(-)